MSSTNKFRVPANNTRLYRSMFYELCGADKTYVVYTLKDQDHEGYPSLYRLYMECNDPTEWKFATTYLDGWEHWEILSNTAYFKPYVDRWRTELELRMKSQALAKIMSESKTSGRDSFAANKYLLEKGWEPKPTNKRGRPTKDDIKQAAYDELSANKQLDEDFVRITGRAN